jgi:hypothetical protein
MADKDDATVVDTPDTPPAVLGSRDIITAIVKDDDDTARAAFHQVLQAKMRDRINPPEAEAEATDDPTEAE